MPVAFVLGGGPLQRQPSSAPPELNNSHPLRGMLRAAYVASVGTVAIDALTGKRRTMPSGVLGWTSPEGGAWQFAAAGVAGFPIYGSASSGGLSTLVSTSAPVWFVVRFSAASNNATRYIAADFSAAGSTASFRINLTAGGQYNFGVAGGGTFFEATGGSVTLGWHTMVCWQSADKKANFIVDGGATVSSASAPAGGVFRDDGTDARLGSGGAFTSSSFDGTVSHFVVGEGELTEPMARWLSENQWSLWSGPATQAFMLPAAGGGGSFFYNPLSGRGGAAAQPLAIH